MNEIFCILLLFCWQIIQPVAAQEPKLPLGLGSNDEPTLPAGLAPKETLKWHER